MTSVDEADLRDTARSLAWLYQLLDDKKHMPPPPREARIMRSTPGPADPAPLWTLDAEDRLLEEREEVDEHGRDLPKDKIIPGGLRNLVLDAANHIGEKVERRDRNRELKPSAADLCIFVGWHPQLICLDFPAADELLELMVEQARWLADRLTPNTDHPDVEDPFLTMSSVQKSLALRELECPEGTIRRWASEGVVATGVRQDRRRTYRLSDVLDQMARRAAV